MGQQPIDYEAERRRAAASRDFTTPAVITLVLYFIFYIPGVVANIVYWNQARNTEAITGQSPEGKSCLVVLALVFVALPVISGFGFCMIWVAVGALSGLTQ